MSLPQTSPTSPGNPSDFFLGLSKKKQKKPQPVNRSTRIVTGLMMGTLLGLVYGLVTQFINSLFSPGVPFALYPFGLTGNLIASIVVWSVIGTLCAWSDSSITGAVIGSLATAVVVILFALAAAPPATESAMTRFFSTSAYLFSFLVFALLSIPFMLVVRWAIDIQGELSLQPLWSWHRLRALLAALLLLGIVMSVMTLYAPDVRQALVDMHGLIQKGLAAPSESSLPAALRADRVNNFLAHAVPNYTLEHSYDKPYQDDLATVLGGPIVVARFQNGWVLACQFGPEHQVPRCKSYEPPLQASNPLFVVRAKPE